jgi:hypothetical protein
MKRDLISFSDKTLYIHAHHMVVLSLAYALHFKEMKEYNQNGKEKMMSEG